MYFYLNMCICLKSWAFSVFFMLMLTVNWLLLVHWPIFTAKSFQICSCFCLWKPLGLTEAAAASNFISQASVRAVGLEVSSNSYQPRHPAATVALFSGVLSKIIHCWVFFLNSRLVEHSETSTLTSTQRYERQRAAQDQLVCWAARCVRNRRCVRRISRCRGEQHRKVRGHAGLRQQLVRMLEP